MKISVVIPAYNEEQQIEKTVREVKKRCSETVKEIIVVDGGSDDNTLQIAREIGAKAVVSPRRGRAAQMNFGATQASCEILYFLHADTLPPKNFDRKIIDGLADKHRAGCFRLTFDDDHWLLQGYAWFTRFDVDAFRFGDQSLFIEAEAFHEIGGFREDHLLMEDNEMVRRIKRRYSFTLLDDEVQTSARSYRDAGVIKLQLVFALIYLMYFLGVEQDVLINIRKKFIR